LQSALGSLAQLQFPRERFEVLLADSGNDRKLRERIESKPSNWNYDLKYIEVARSNRSAQLNAAISIARGQILVFGDDDCIFPPDWLDKIGDVFEHESNIGVAGGLDSSGSNEPPFILALDYVLNSFLGTGGLRRQGQAVGKYYPKLWNMAIPREVSLSVILNEHDGILQVFNESLDVHEDVELVHRIEENGKRIIFAPEIMVTHSRDTTLQTFTKRSFNMARTSRRIGVHRLPHVFLAFFALGMIMLVISALINQQARNVFLIVSALYAAALIVSGLGGYMRTRQFPVFIYVPILLLTQHFSRGLGYLFPWRDLN